MRSRTLTSLNPFRGLRHCQHNLHRCVSDNKAGSDVEQLYSFKWGFVPTRSCKLYRLRTRNSRRLPTLNLSLKVCFPTRSSLHLRSRYSPAQGLCLDNKWLTDDDVVFCVAFVKVGDFLHIRSHTHTHTTHTHTHTMYLKLVIRYSKTEIYINKERPRLCGFFCKI